MAVGGGGGGTVANLQVVVGANVAGALLGFQTIQGAISAVVDTVKQFVSSGIEMNSFLESSELQFKTLTGSATAAHDKVSELFDLAAHTPFTFESVTVAARQLEVFGGAALDTEANLRMLGDAAAATAAPIEQVTFWTGRLYSALQAGEPIGMATMWLQRMGVLSAEATQRMKALSESGASASAVWKAFTDSQQRFSGAMKEQEGTWKGLTSTMSDTLDLLSGEATHAGFVRLEGDIKKVNAALADPSGHQGAAALGQAFEGLVRAGEAIGSGIDVSVVQPLQQLAGTAAGVKRVTDNMDLLARVMADIDLEGNLPKASADWQRFQGAIADTGATTTGFAGAGVSLNQAMYGLPPTIAAATDATKKLTSAQEEAKKAGSSVAEMYRDETQRILQVKGALADLDTIQRRANDALRDAKTHGDSAVRTYDSLAGSVSTLAAAERQRLLEQGQQLANVAGNPSQDEIIWNARKQMALNAADAAQKAQAAQLAYAQAVAGANQSVMPLGITLEDRLNAARNRQVREGTAGTTAAENELQQIRQRALAQLPNLASLERQYNAAQEQQRTATINAAAAERDRAEALAASGGKETLQTIALQQSADAFKAQAAAAGTSQATIRQQIGQTTSTTNELAQSLDGVKRAYSETADEAQRAFDRIVNAPLPLVDTLQQQIDEAINTQTRNKTLGTAAAEKQLNDIRKAHLATLPDLVALDKQYADAQRDSHAADVAVAAAERDLQKALAATGGTQTLQTAALAHGVTAAKQAADAAHDHAAALSAERSQAISDTNALKDLGNTTKDTADAVKGFQNLGGGAFDAMASGAASASIAMNTLKAAVRSTQTELDRLQEQADRASMIGQQQGIASQMNDLDTSEQTLPMRQQLLPLQQQMDDLRLAREATDNKQKQKQLDKEIASVQLDMDRIQNQIDKRQREGQARALEQELRVIPYQRQRLWMENDILDVKEQQLDVQMAINNAERATMPSNGVITPPFFQLTESGWRATPQQGVSVNFNAPVYGSAEFDQRVKQAVETLDRTNNLRFTRYASR